MTQPKFAPIPIEDEVRPAFKLEVPRPWVPHRPGDTRQVPRGRMRNGGAPGPDQGYALALADRLEPRVVLGAGEHLEDAKAAAVAIAMLRASKFGRAPVMADVEFGLACLSYLAEVDPKTQELRRSIVSGASHNYLQQRALVEQVPVEHLGEPPSAVTGLLLRESADS